MTDGRHFQDLAGDVLAARRARPLLKAARAFVELLVDVPDSAVSEWTPETLALLRTASEGVVDAIETQIYESDDRSLQTQLASTVYDIRRSLEAIHLWERHHFGAHG